MIIELFDAEGDLDLHTVLTLGFTSIGAFSLIYRGRLDNTSQPPHERFSSGVQSSAASVVRDL